VIALLFLAAFVTFDASAVVAVLFVAAMIASSWPSSAF